MKEEQLMQQTAEAAVTTGEKAPVAGEQEDFETLIKGRCKQEFDARVKKILDGRLKGLKRENERLRAAQTQREEESRAALAALENQQHHIRQIYPAFDWRAEVRNGAFARLIAAGVDAKTAYEVVHHGEILRDAMAYSAKRASAAAAATVASGVRRTAETGRRAAAVTASDPRALTSSELADIRRRVLDGEKIRF